MPDFSFATLIGLVGTLLCVASPLFRSRLGMLVTQLLGGGAFAVHFALIGAWTGAAIDLLASAQAGLAIPLGSRPGFRLLYLASVPLILISVALTWQGLPSAFVGLAMLLMSVGRYQLDVFRFRVFMLAAIPCWLAHNLLVWSAPGFLSDCFSIATNLWMLVQTRAPAWRLRSAPVRPIVSP